MHIVDSDCAPVTSLSISCHVCVPSEHHSMRCFDFIEIGPTGIEYRGGQAFVEFRYIWDGSSMGIHTLCPQGIVLGMYRNTTPG